ncbi:MAG: 30S ribosomal protein S2 [Candidatus Gracilibacteria bacterium]|nr:30S ribosomal protein S2 [Candidatus Gracilibacteria bacterium]
MNVTMKDLLEAGCHFGHRCEKWNPKMKKFIYGEKAGIHIIDLEQTAHSLNKALGFLKQVASEGEPILFVSTKSQTSVLVPEKAAECKMPYVSTRWLGGFLTNFPTMKTRIKHYRDLELAQASGELEGKYTKKEIVLIKRELAKLDKYFSGVKNLNQFPGAVFVVDPIRDHLAVKEACALKIPVVALVDTNADPDLIDYPIPANDDAIKSLALMVGLVSQVIAENFKEKSVASKESKPAPKPVEAAKAQKPVVNKAVEKKEEKVSTK